MGWPKLAVSHKPCDRAHFGYFATQPVWRYAASLARSAGYAGRPIIGCAPGAASTSISSEAREGRILTLKRMDNVLIVVDDLEAAKAFFIELGLKLEGETTVEGPSVGS